MTRNVQSNTVQILVANEGNRRALRDMLADEFDVETDRSLRHADLYLVEDRLLPEYREQLREHVSQTHPVFCPVVIVQRDHTSRNVEPADTYEREDGGKRPLLVDEFVDAPINKQRLVSRLRSLLVRRQQSLELQEQVETLERQERDLRRFERAVEDGGTATAITDTTGVIEYVNSEFEELTGYGEREAVGHSLRRFLTDESLETIDESFWRTMAEKREWEGELLIESKTDRRRITDASITPIRDDAGETEGFAVVMPDITPRIEQEQLLRDREQELDLLRQILSRYLRHNLRNDLNVILGYGEFLTEKLPERDARDATRIVDTASRLIERSETARKYSTLIEQESALAPRDVAAIVTTVASDAREEYPNVSIDTETPEACHVLARAGIEEAIRELIDNAARHNTADTPWIRVAVTDSDGVRIVIEDNGPGISEMELETLDRESETALKHSQGIGLWLSKWVIERSDGRLSFDATDDGGTRVTIDFPPVEQTGATDVTTSELKAREQRLETITQRMTDAVLEVNASWEISFVDRRAEEILGIDADAIRGRQFWDVFSDVRDTRFETVYRDVMQSRAAETIEEYYAGIDGWLEAYVYPDFDGGISLYFRDITDRKQRERELERARSRMELALEVTDAAVWEWEIGTDVVTMHPERDPVFGTTIRTMDDFTAEIHPDDRPRVEAALDDAVETGSPYEVEFRLRTDGAERWVADYGELQYDADGDAERVVGVARDITERKRRETELELKSRAIDEAPMGITISDPTRGDNPLIYANDRFERLTGYAEAEALGRNCRFLQGENTDENRVAEMREAIDAGEPVTVELRNYRADGAEFWNRVSIAPVRADDERISHYVGFQQDVTDERERERLVEAVFNNTYTFIGVMDPDGTLREANEVALSFAGLKREDVVGKPIWETYWFQENRNASATARKAVTRARQGELFRDEIRVQGQEEVTVIDFTVRPVLDEDGTVTLLVPEGRDITDRKEHETQLETMIDNLPGYVYRHEFGSEYPLTFVKGDAKTVTGYTATELEDEVILAEEIVHPDDRESLWTEHLEGIEATGRFDSTYRIITKHGDVRWIRDRGQLLDDPVTGEPVIDGFVTDVSEQVKRKQELERSEQYRQRIYEIASATEPSIDRKIERLLDLGRDMLEMENAHVAEIDHEKRRHTIRYATGSDLVTSGTVRDLSDTLCRETIKTDDVLEIFDTETANATEEFGGPVEGIGCYVGSKLIVEGEQFGTVCFVDREPRDAPLSDPQKALVDLIGRWISHLLQSER